MDLGKLIQLEKESRENADLANKEARQLITEQENRLYEIFKKTKGATSLQYIQELNSEEDLRLRYAELDTSGLDPAIVLERILGENNLLDINYLKKALKVAKTVARISYSSFGNKRKAIGTGSLVGPNLLLTNNHVIGSPDTSLSCFAEFDYEAIDEDKNIGKYSTFTFRPNQFFITSRLLDYTIVALNRHSEDEEKLLTTYDFNKIGSANRKTLIGEAVNIIQHPLGKPKQIALRENKVLGIEGKYLLYGTDTDKGSSGSLVLNDQWQVVALHRAGMPQNQNGKRIWVANQGILIDYILTDLEKRLVNLKGNPKRLLRELLQDYKKNKKDALQYTVPGTAPSKVEKISTPIPFNSKVVNAIKNNEQLLFDVIIEESLDKVKQHIQQIFPTAKITNLYNIQKKEARFIKNLKNIIKVELKNDRQNIWEVAKQLENIEGIVEVDPDIPFIGHSPDAEQPNRTDDETEGFIFDKPANNKEEIEEKHPGITPNWNHAKAGFPKAIEYAMKQNKLTSQTEINIAQIDTGYTNHPKILLMNKKNGHDYLDGDSKPQDDNKLTFPIKNPGHGMRTASVLIGAPTHLKDDFNNGVFTYVNYVPFRVSDSVVILGTRTAERVANVVMQAIREAYQVIVMSMGGLGKSVWRLAAKEAYENGIIWVCAAGNVARFPDFVVRPAAYPGTIATAASNYKDKPWLLSMRGPEVDITAPGENIYVPKFDEKGTPTFSYGSGTSYAVPHVAGAAALWLHYHKEALTRKYGITPKDKWKKVEAFRQLLSRTARIPKNWNTDSLGTGILDVNALIREPLPSISAEQHAYKQKTFKQHLKNYKNQRHQLEQKELLYLFRNGEITFSEEAVDWETKVSSGGMAYLEQLKSDSEMDSLELNASISMEDQLILKIDAWDR